MNQTIAVISGLVELALSIGFAIFVIYLALAVFRRITSPMDGVGELNQNNSSLR